MEYISPQKIASRFFRRFVILWVCLALAWFLIHPFFPSHASGSYVTSGDSSKARSDIIEYLNANGFQLDHTARNSGQADIYTGCYKNSFPFMVSVSRPKEGNNIFEVSFNYHFSGFEYKVNDSRDKIDNFKIGINACLQKSQARLTMVTGILPSPQFSAALRALNQRNGIQKLAEPEVATYPPSYYVNVNRAYYNMKFTFNMANR
jgi:hypothetical protein